MDVPAGTRRTDGVVSVSAARPVSGVVSETRFEVRLAVAQLEPRVDRPGIGDDREADARREQPREHQRAATSPGADAAKPGVSALQPVAAVPQMERLSVAEAGAEGACASSGDAGRDEIARRSSTSSSPDR